MLHTSKKSNQALAESPEIPGQYKPNHSNKLDNQEDKVESLSIDDLCLAAFLRSTFDLPLKDLTRRGRRVTFIFSTEGKDGQSMVKQYYNGGKVIANDFARQLSDLKVMIHNVA